MSEHSILLTTDAPSLQFPDETRRNKFELGVASAVFLWDDLATAVANGWGGPDSAAKREWLAAAVIDLFDENEVTTDDVEFRLLAAMEDEFDVTIETGTALNVAKQVIQVYQDCADQNYKLVEDLYQKFQTRAPANQVVVQDDEDGNDEDDESEDEIENSNETEPQLMDVEPKQQQGPLVDDDGFTIVQKKSRR